MMFQEMQTLPSRFLERGQVALVTLLIMVVMLTVGLSVSTRVSQDLRLTQSEEASGQAFQAAESGIEDAFAQDLTNTALFGQGDSFSGSLEEIEGIDVSYTVSRQRNLDSRIQQGSSAQIVLVDGGVGPIGSSRLAIDWGAGQGCGGSQSENAASILVRIFNNTGGVWSVRNEAYAACSYTGSYSTANTVAGENGQNYRAILQLQTGDQFVRVEPVFNDTTMYVTGTNGFTLPPQSFQVRSVAQNTSNNETKAIEVSRSAPTYPNVFDYVLFSGTTITK